MSVTASGFVLAAVIVACVATLHWLDRRLVRSAAREWEQARAAARASGLADRRPQDEIQGWQ
jgi:hypothetical protein